MSYFRSKSEFWSKACPKYRKEVLVDEIKTFLEDQLETIAATKGWDVLELQVMPDHIHLFISAPPSDSPMGIVKVLKGVTALRLFKKHPEVNYPPLKRWACR